MDIITPISIEYKNLLSNNSELYDLKEFFTDYVSRILLSKKNIYPNSIFLEKSEFEGFEKYLEYVLKYRKIMLEKGIENVGLLLVDKLIMGQSLDEFSNFILNNYGLQNERFSYFLNNSYKKKNFINLLRFNRFDENSLMNIINDDRTFNYIDDSNEGIFASLLNLEGFTCNNLIQIANNQDIAYLFEYGNEEIFHKIGKIYNYRNTEDLINLSASKKLVNIIVNGNYNIIDKILYLFKINKRSELINLINIKEIGDIFVNGIEERIDELFLVYNIQTIDDLKSVFNDKKYSHIKGYIINKNIKHFDIKSIFSLEKTKNNTHNVNVGINTNLVDNCPDNELLNLQILLGDNKNYILFNLGNEILGILKIDGEKAFLSFMDVYDFEGNLIFLKGYIYNLEIDGKKVVRQKYPKYKKIDLLNFDGEITRNPMRPINKFKQEKVDEYVNYRGDNNFDSIVDYFKKNIISKN